MPDFSKTSQNIINDNSEESNDKINNNNINENEKEKINENTNINNNTFTFNEKSFWIVKGNMDA